MRRRLGLTVNNRRNNVASDEVYFLAIIPFILIPKYPIALNTHQLQNNGHLIDLTYYITFLTQIPMTTMPSRGNRSRSAVPYTAENPSFQPSLFTDTMIHNPDLLTQQYNDIHNNNNNNDNNSDITIPKTFFENNNNDNDNDNNDIELAGNANDADSLPENWWYSYDENNNNREINNNININNNSSSSSSSSSNRLSHDNDNNNSLASNSERDTDSFLSAHYGNTQCKNFCNVCSNNNNARSLSNSNNNSANEGDSLNSIHHYENTFCMSIRCNICHSDFNNDNRLSNNNNDNSLSDNNSNNNLANDITSESDSFDSSHYVNIICKHYCLDCHGGVEKRENRQSLPNEVQNENNQEDTISNDSVPTMPPPAIPWQTVWISSNSDLSLSEQHDYASISETEEDPNYLSAIKTEFPPRHSTMDPASPANNRPLQPHEHCPSCRFYKALPLVSRVPKLEYLATLAHNSVIELDISAIQ